jgi:hypothetical protein
MRTWVSLAREEEEEEEGIMGKLVGGCRILLVVVMVVVVVMNGLLDCSRTRAMAKVGVRVEVGRMSIFHDDIECLSFLSFLFF